MDKWLINLVVSVVTTIWMLGVIAGYFDRQYQVPSTVHFCMTTIIGAAVAQKVIARSQEINKKNDQKREIEAKRIIKEATKKTGRDKRHRQSERHRRH